MEESSGRSYVLAGFQCRLCSGPECESDAKRKMDALPKENRAAFTSRQDAVTGFEVGKVRLIGNRFPKAETVPLIQVYLYAMPVA